MHIPYDIFISYRRKGGAQYARIIQLMLAQRGYKVFLDYDESRDGVFGKCIKAAIKEAPVFILMLSKDALDRCCNEDDWMREEIMLAIQEGKKIIPINPDKTFDGIHSEIPKEIKEVACDVQHSEIDFGQALGVTVDLMIRDRLVPCVGKREASGHKDEDYNAAQETLRKIDQRNRFIKRLAIGVATSCVMITLATCFIFWKHHIEKEAAEAETAALNELRSELEKKHEEFNLQLSPHLSREQMNTIDTLLIQMKEVKKDTLWVSQFEFTVRQWHELLGEKYNRAESHLPITNVAFDEVNFMLLDSLRNMTGIEFTLPSVEEWQYAARGGINHETTKYVGSNDVDSVAWYKGNSNNKIHAVNDIVEKGPNSLDIFAMSGNVCELCNTPYPHQKGNNAQWTVCGGNYKSEAADVTALSIAPIGVDEKSDVVGFRLAIRKE